MTPELRGKVALVTGAASGIGRASALAFAQAGAKVAVVDIDQVSGEQTVQMIEDMGVDATFIAANMASAADVASMVKQTVSMFGRLDFAHNNAGISGDQVLLAEYDEAMWDQVVTINLKGVWLCMKYEIQHMLKHGGGAIVNTASVAGLVGSRGVCAYVASKHGVVGLTKVAALEYARSNIRVNAICPGTVHTAMIDRFAGNDPQVLAAFAEGEPIGRLAQPEEIGATAVWLCSPAASFITGAALPVDGGRVAQ
jgi:NAD(P)-dependent dehydrogenase (short-subunit alcohol dehydrogenase family)